MDQTTITPVHTQARLTSFLVDAGTVTEDQVKAALVHQRITGARIGETLVALGSATEEDIAWALARQLSIPFIDVQLDMLDKELIRRFPPSLLDRLQAVPLINTDGTLSTAMADPTDADAVASLEHYAGARIAISVATPSTIKRVLRELCHTLSNEVQPSSRSGAAFLAAQVAGALEVGASELHWIAGPEGLQVSRRIHGRLIPQTMEPAHLLTPLLNRLEALGLPVPKVSAAHHRSGRIQVPIDDREVEVDVSVLTHDRGTAIRMRLLVEHGPRTLSELGLDPQGERALRGALAQRTGLVIVNALPGAGGSTTLSCLMDALSESGRRVLALTSTAAHRKLEVLPGVLLVTVPSHVSAKYWEEMVVGQDPEVVVLSDLTSGDEIALALAPALSGRLVLARTDWEDPFALLEFLGYGPRTRAAACARLQLVIEQRKLRAGVETDRGEGQSTAAAARHEITALGMNSQLRRAIRSGASAVELHQIAAQDGYRGPSPMMG